MASSADRSRTFPQMHPGRLHGADRGLLRKACCLVLAAMLLGGCATTSPGEFGTDPDAGDPLAKLHTQLGQGYLQEGQFELAWQRLNRALKIDEHYGPAHNALGVLYERLNQLEKAEEHYRRATELNPADSGAQNNFGGFLCRRGRIEDAEERFLKALSNPLYASPEAAYSNAGLCLRNAQNLEKAEYYLRRALEINPRLPAALLAMSELSFDLERYLPARAYLQRYLEVGDHTPGSLWLGIRIERELGDRDAVSSYALLLKANFPDSQETGMLLKSAGGQP